MDITSEEEALATVSVNGRELENVPENLRTSEVCLAAVKHDGDALQYVPWGQLNLPVPAMAEIYVEAMKTYDRQIQNAPANRYGMDAVMEQYCNRIKDKIERILEEMPEELCEEVLSRLGWSM